MHVESVTLLPFQPKNNEEKQAKLLVQFALLNPAEKEGGVKKQKRDRNSRPYLHTSSMHQRSHTKRCIEVEGFSQQTTEGKIESRENRRRRRRSSSSRDTTFATADDTPALEPTLERCATRK
jgi:hypothetical protein